MLYKTHFLFSLFLGLIFIKYFPQQNTVIFLVLVTLSGFLPDIDTPQSKLGRKLKIISWPLNFIFGHRKFFHSIFPPLVIYIILHLSGYSYLGFAVFLGYLTHLIGDSFSKEGIAFFYPLTEFKVTGFFKTGGIIEKIIYYCLTIVIIYFVLQKGFSLQP